MGVGDSQTIQIQAQYLSMTLHLYTRPDCGLCVEAEALLRAAGCGYDAINIERDLALIRRFGDCIPVVENPESGQTIQWPFDARAITSLMNHADKGPN